MIKWRCLLSLFCLKISFKTKFTLRAGGQLSALLSWEVEGPKVQDQLYYENLGDEVIVNTRIRSTCTLMHQIKYNGFLELFWLCFPQPSKPSTQAFFHETLISPMIKGTCTLKITCTHHHQTWLPSNAFKCLPNEKILKTFFLLELNSNTKK